ncbi:MAG: hypothetical protein ACLRXC_13815 [[Clostridium] leptum]
MSANSMVMSLMRTACYESSKIIGDPPIGAIFQFDIVGAEPGDPNPEEEYASVR